jgi:anti-sigma regulatory factor (Ser/Thr protein kinase)
MRQIDAIDGSLATRSYLELPSRVSVIPRARLHARQLVRDWDLQSLADDTELLVSELVTNAVTAARVPAAPDTVVLALLTDRRRLVIETWDHSPDDPRPHPSNPDSERGRGLIIIEALSHRWGCQRVTPTLKDVWCELLTGSQVSD